jgi:toxin-antitoxin system PIN domain toxin
MLMPDVNVLVGAYRTDVEHHVALKTWLETAVSAGESVGISDAVASGFVRVVTHPRVFAVPTPLETSLAQMRSLLAASGVLRVTPSDGYWDVFDRLCVRADARGNLVADAAHAAVAIQTGATWITLDRDFARFEGLKWRSPLEQ